MTKLDDKPFGDPAVQEAAEMREKLDTIAGWVHWFDNGGGASKALAGIRDTLNGTEEK